MKSQILGQQQTIRPRPRLLLGGMPFLGTVEELRAVDTVIDQAAVKLEAAHPEHFPAGTGKARHTLLVRLRLEFEPGATPADITKWLAKHGKTVF